MEIFFKETRVLSRLRSNSFGSSIDDFAQYLSTQGYSPITAGEYLRVVGHFCYWLKIEAIPLASVNEATANEFLYKHPKECCCHTVKGGSIRHSRPALKHFLYILRNDHLIALPPEPYPVSSLDKIMDDFSVHLDKIRGITQPSINLYLRFIRKFLEDKFRDGTIEFQKLGIEDVRDYVTTRAEAYKPKTVKSLTTSLRVFFSIFNDNRSTGLSSRKCRPHRKGATLKEIADLLHHRSIETTNIYAKVDLKGLTQVALPWPEVIS